MIDAETKKPIAGAVVLAYWNRNFLTPTGGSSYFFEAKEVVTDKDGYYEIPAYTPINVFGLISRVLGPYFVIFKPGYGPVADLSAAPMTPVSIYAIGPSEIEYSKFYEKKDADGKLLYVYAIYTMKKYDEGLIYYSATCKAPEKGLQSFRVYTYYLPFPGAREKIEKSEVPLDCPKDVEPVPNVNTGHKDEIAKNIYDGFRITALPRLKTREERVISQGSVPPTSIPYDLMPNLIRLTNEENVNLGFEQRRVK